MGAHLGCGKGCGGWGQDLFGPFGPTPCPYSRSSSFPPVSWAAAQLPVVLRTRGPGPFPPLLCVLSSKGSLRSLRSSPWVATMGYVHVFIFPPQVHASLPNFIFFSGRKFSKIILSLQKSYKNSRKNPSGPITRLCSHFSASVQSLSSLTWCLLTPEFSSVYLPDAGTLPTPFLCDLPAGKSHPGSAASPPTSPLPFCQLSQFWSRVLSSVLCI